MEPDQLSYGRRLGVLAICCMSLLIVGLDVTIVNVALPSIQRELHATVSGLQWTVDAYTLVLASLLMLSGSTADRIGRRRMFQTGLALFTLGSLACSLAPGLGWLVAFRMLQAVGGSMLNPVAMSIITNTFLDPKERARAVGFWGATVGLSMALGPIVGGLLVQTVGWRGIFWVNIPVGLAALVLTALFVPESRAPRARRPDPAGQLLVIVALVSLIYAIIEGPGAGWTSGKIVAGFFLSAVAVIALIRFESRRTDPLIELRFFRSAPFSGATLIAVCAFAAFGGFLLLNTLYLQDVLGYSPLKAGAYTLPMAAMTALFSPLSGRIVGQRGPRLPLILAGIAVTVSGLMLTRISHSTPVGWLLASYVVFGFGFGMVNAPITNTAVSGMPRSQAGVAAAIASTSRQVGASLGVAIMGSAALSALHGSFRLGFPLASHVGWWILTGCGLAVLALGVLTTGSRARATAERTRVRFGADRVGAERDGAARGTVAGTSATNTGAEFGTVASTGAAKTGGELGGAAPDSFVRDSSIRDSAEPDSAEPDSAEPDSVRPEPSQPTRT